MISVVVGLLLSISFLAQSTPAEAVLRQVRPAPPPPAATTQPVEAGVSAAVSTAPLSSRQPSTQPSTQPTTQPSDDWAFTAFGKTFTFQRDDRFVQTLKGERNLDINEVLDAKYWVNQGIGLFLQALGFIPRIISALFLFFVFWVIYRMVRKLLLGSLRAAGMDQSIMDMLGSLLRWAILGFGLIIACNQIGVQIAALLTGVSIIGLAIGFAVQESLQNFIAGILIFWDRPFKVGDWIEIEGVHAQVKRVTFRSTRLTDLDGDMIVFPNTQMLSNKLVNKSANRVTRVNVPIGIAYKESIDEARQVLLALAAADERIEKTPQPSVVVKECAASSVDLVLRFWIQDEGEENAMKYEFLEKAKGALDAAGIEIPFPHLQLFVEKSHGLEQLSLRKSA